MVIISHSKNTFLLVVKSRIYLSEADIFYIDIQKVVDRKIDQNSALFSSFSNSKTLVQLLHFHRSFVVWLEIQSLESPN